MKMGETPRPRLTPDQLQEVKANTGWQRVFTALGLVQHGAKNKPHDWWALSPFKSEKTASFHIDESGYYYCFATGQGGDLLDLVQRLQGLPHVYAAATWLLEYNCSYLGHVGLAEPPVVADTRGRVAKLQAATASPEKRKKTPNKPIRQNLLPLLTEQGTHPQFAERGISAVTCERLGCGYLDPSALQRRENSMAGKIVFQVRGVGEGLGFKPVVLSHVGRATTPEQVAQAGKWTFYKGFAKTLEIYGLDLALHDPAALEQAQATGHWLLVEGCFDVAKCLEAGIANVVASFGAHLSPEQTADRLALLAAQTGVDRFVVWYDRDEAGDKGQRAALQTLLQHDLQGESFRWDRRFPSPVRGAVALPPEVNDVCALTVEQLQWLRGQGVV